MKGQGRLLSEGQGAAEGSGTEGISVCLTLGSRYGSGASNSPEVLGIYSIPRVLNTASIHSFSTPSLIPTTNQNKKNPDIPQEASSLFKHPVLKRAEVQTARASWLPEQINLAEQHGICFSATSNSQEPACSAQVLAFQ